MSTGMQKILPSGEDGWVFQEVMPTEMILLHSWESLPTLFLVTLFKNVKFYFLKEMMMLFR